MKIRVRMCLLILLFVLSAATGPRSAAVDKWSDRRTRMDEMRKLMADKRINWNGGSWLIFGPLLLGRRTYDMWSGFWPKAPSSPMADGFNAATKYIVTHRPESLEWGPFEGLGPDIVEGIRRIKSQAGPDLILWGSSTLTSALLEHGLADEVMLVVYPVLLGTGKRFFAEGTPPRSFELVSTKAMPSGIILSTYKVAGPLKTA
jgi:dihydrofolate reductase